MKNRKFQQGDVVLKQIDQDLESMTQLKTTTLQEGEVTGHSHVIHGEGATIFENPSTKERFLRLVTDSILRHEEHSPINLPPGTYKIGIVREVDHLNNIIRRVVD